MSLNLGTGEKPVAGDAVRRTEDGRLIQETTTSRVMRGMLFGQLLSLVMTIMAVTSKLLVERWAFSTPALQNTLGYFTLAVLTMLPYSGVKPTESGTNSRRRTRLLALFCIALADSQASYLGNMAFRYKVTVSSAGMLSSFTIPCVMMLSFLFLGAKYRKRQVFGVLIALFGLACVFLSDAASESAIENAEGVPIKASVTGDVFVVLSSAIYAVANVITEGYVKSQEFYEYLLWLGCFGFMISAVQFILSELPMKRAQLHEISHVEASFALYAILFALFYFFAGKFLIIYDAVALNLSLLTTGLWGMVFGAIVFNERMPVLKILGYAAMVAGITLYNTVTHAFSRADGTALVQGRERGASYGSVSRA